MAAGSVTDRNSGAAAFALASRAATTARNRGPPHRPGLLMRRSRAGLALRVRFAPRLKYGLEVDRVQQYRRKPGAHDRIGDHFARVGIKNVRAGDPQYRFEVLLRQIAYLEYAALRRLDQENRLFGKLGRHGHAHHHLEVALIDRAGAGIHLYLDLRRVAFEVNPRRIWHFHRGILHEQFLARKHRRIWLLAHVDWSRWMG